MSDKTNVVVSTRINGWYRGSKWVGEKKVQKKDEENENNEKKSTTNKRRKSLARTLTNEWSLYRAEMILIQRMKKKKLVI